MPSIRVRSRVTISLLLSYLLVILLCTPFSASGRRLSAVKPANSAAEQPPARYRAGEVLVRFRTGVSQRDKDIIIAGHGARRKKNLGDDSGLQKLELSPGRDARAAVLELAVNPQVQSAELNFLISKDDLTPNDPEFSKQWGLHNTGQNGGQYGSDVKAATAWDTTTGAKTTVIAVIDSGIDFTHPDLANNQWNNPTPGPQLDLHGWDFVAGSAEIKDEQGHGTEVAGIIAAEGNNSLGITGVMWQASLMSLRVLDSSGTGDVATAVEAIDYAVAHGAQVINLSWGTTGESLALKEAIERALRRNVVVVCSAGNTSQDVDANPYYPASFKLHDMIAVGATDNYDQPASWSNWGQKSVTIAAPGVNIFTTQKGGAYGSVTGTSAAAPLVTGVVGLLKSARSSLNVRAVKQALTSSARQVVSLAGKVQSGGVVDAQGALGSLRPSNPGNGNPGGGNSPRGAIDPAPGGTFAGEPPANTGAPAANLPDLDQLKKNPVHQPNNSPAAPIQSNMICADCDPQSGGGGGGYYPSGDPNFGTARNRPQNETGQRGEDLGSQNFNWSLPILKLQGRAGLDLDLTLFYNSLVWTKDGSYIKYNADLGNPAPGFKLGFPTLQQRFTDSQTGANAFLMVDPSGGRVVMRQIGTSNLYESQDNSYTHLTDNGAGGAVVRMTDGTQFSFTPVTVNSEYRCTQIKDRNGNYISATYNTTNGHLLSITDTLGRVINFIYDANSNLQAIRQTWSSGAHDWATFTYTDVFVSPAFGGGLLVNGPNGNNVTVLSRVTLDDGSYFTFDYNTAFGQVKKINHYAFNNELLGYTSYNVSSAAGQTDCPRFTERRDWAQYWNGDTDRQPTSAEEAVTGFSVDAGGAWSKVTLPNGTVYKEIFETSGWRKGLTSSTKAYENSAAAQADTPKKWTTTSWTQDDVNLTYQKNPRVSETNIYDDSGNRKRTTTEYTSFGLPSIIREWIGSAGNTLYRTITTTYRFDGVYLNRRIIGLPDVMEVRDGGGALVSRIGYGYDWDSHMEALPNGATAIQHDANYGVSFYYGRGNRVLVQHFDVSDASLQTKVEYKFSYNTNGQVSFQWDPGWHFTRFNYADSFSDSVNRNTFAYPTTVTDPDNFNTTIKYNFDFGAMTRKQSPAPAGQSQGLIQTWSFDSARRVNRITTVNNSAYTRFVYTSNFTEVQSFETINNATEQYSVTLLDGAGRVRATASELPGSVGGYAGRLTGYDVMGRVNKSSNPTEMNSSWVPTGDDSSWQYTLQSYDWNGRPAITTLQDGWTRENLYTGCGCAGGEVVTTRDEAGRRRRATSDGLGRLVKMEELNWNQSVYSTSSYTYNVRDQITSITQQSNRVRTFNYDGYGRIKTRVTPEQGTTTYTYFDDGLPNTVTDARGAKTTFTYNARHLVTNITYDTSQAAGVASTPNVSFGYDSAGNRTSMTDGQGSMSYAYDQLSRMTSETRNFTGVGSYTLSYGYNLSGELTSFTNPWNAQVGYSYDKAGRLTSMSGSGYSGVSSYANSFTYRAFGSLKGLTYGNGRSLSATYDNRLRPTRWNFGTTQDYKYFYDYFNEHTGRVTYAQNMNDGRLDRSYEYDQVGRLGIAHSGAEARAHAFSGQWGTMDGPYSLGFDYDVWGNLTHRYGWGGEVQGGSAGQSSDIYYSYTNANRRTGFGYDNAGNLTNDLGQLFTYDAIGQQASASYGGYSLQQSSDGDGRRVKKVENGATTYYLRSSVLGGKTVAEIIWASVSWQWSRGYVYSASGLLAIQQFGVYWVHEDSVTKSKRITNSSGTVVSSIELDPWGADAGAAWSSNAGFQPKKFTTYDRDGNGSDEAMLRRYNRWHSRFDQPDPYGGSYTLADPQSFNRYAYTQNDPVNFVDPSGLLPCGAEYSFNDCGGGAGFWGGGGGFGGHIGAYNREYGGLTPHVAEAMGAHNERLKNTLDAIAANAAYQRGGKNDPIFQEIWKNNQNLWLIPVFSPAQIAAFQLITLLFGQAIGDQVRFMAVAQLTGLDAYIKDWSYEDSNRTFTVNFEVRVDKLLDSSPYFAGPGLALLHLDVGTFDYRSHAELTGGLSMQVVPGRNGGLAYADFDSINPYRDPVSFFQHSIPIIGRKIGRLFR